MAMGLRGACCVRFECGIVLLKTHAVAAPLCVSSDIGGGRGLPELVHQPLPAFRAMGRLGGCRAVSAEHFNPLGPPRSSTDGGGGRTLGLMPFPHLTQSAM